MTYYSTMNEGKFHWFHDFLEWRSELCTLWYPRQAVQLKIQDLFQGFRRFQRARQKGNTRYHDIHIRDWLGSVVIVKHRNASLCGL